MKRSEDSADNLMENINQRNFKYFEKEKSCDFFINDWEEFILEENQSIPYNEFKNNCLSKNIINELTFSSMDDEENFVLINSEKKEIHLSKEKENIIFENINSKDIDFKNDEIVFKEISKVKSIFHELIQIIISGFKGVYHSFFLVYFLVHFFLTLLWVIIQKSLVGLRNSSKILIIFFIPIQIFFSKFYEGISFIWRHVFIIKSSAGSNNNASDDEEELENISICLYTFLFLLLVGGFLGHCWFNPDSKVCSINNVIQEIKFTMGIIGKDVYNLPGEDCMEAAGSSKWILESIFKWYTCLMTLPIRATLISWPKKDLLNEEHVESLGEMKVTVNKIIEDLLKIKDVTQRQSELTIKMKIQVTSLEKVIKENSLEIIMTDSLTESAKKIMESSMSNISTVENEIKAIVSILKDQLEVNEDMRVIEKKYVTEMNRAASKVQDFARDNRKMLTSKIENVEQLISDFENKTPDSTEALLQKLKLELNEIKLSHEQIKDNLISLKNLPEKYKRSSNKIKTKIKNKLNDEFTLLNQLSANTDCSCMKGIENFKKELQVSESDYICFVGTLVDQESTKIKKKIKTEISSTLYDKTVEIAKKAAEDALSTQVQDLSPGDTVIKAAGFLSEIKIMDIIPERCDSEVLKVMNFSTHCQNKDQMKSTFSENDKCLSNEQINKMIKMAVAKYSADKVGLADFAIESMGGSVIASQSSSTYYGLLGWWSFMFIPFSQVSHSLRMIIQPNNQPGDCWPFKGPTGHVVVQLAYKILVNAITVEHLPASLSINGRISSAPKLFSIYSKSENTQETEELIGYFEYKDNSSSIQTFFVQIPRLARFIKMDILSNHGNKEYTCLYRLRVHGSLQETRENDM